MVRERQNIHMVWAIHRNFCPKSHRTEFDSDAQAKRVTRPLTLRGMDDACRRLLHVLEFPRATHLHCRSRRSGSLGVDDVDDDATARICRARKRQFGTGTGDGPEKSRKKT